LFGTGLPFLISPEEYCRGPAVRCQTMAIAHPAKSTLASVVARARKLRPASHRCRWEPKCARRAFVKFPHHSKENSLPKSKSRAKAQTFATTCCWAEHRKVEVEDSLRASTRRRLKKEGMDDPKSGIVQSHCGESRARARSRRRSSTVAGRQPRRGGDDMEMVEEAQASITAQGTDRPDRGAGRRRRGP